MRDEDDELSRLRRGPGWFGVVLTSLIVSVLGSAGTIVWLNRAPPGFLGLRAREEAVVAVPALRFLPVEAAREVLTARGLRLEQGTRQADPEVPADRVAAQSPEAGERVPRGRTVLLTLSRGPVPVVPPVLGRSLAEARAVLATAGIPVGAFEETGVVAPGTVTATRPAVGEPVVPGSGVTLVVTPSAPPAPAGTADPTAAASPVPAAPAATTAPVEVPALRRLSLARAREALSAAGLAVGEVRVVYEANARPHAVLRQSVEAGQRTAPGTPIDLVVNQGE